MQKLFRTNRATFPPKVLSTIVSVTLTILIVLAGLLTHLGVNRLPDFSQWQPDSHFKDSQQRGLLRHFTSFPFHFVLPKTMTGRM